MNTESKIEKIETNNTYKLTPEAMEALDGISEYEFWAESDALHALGKKIEEIDRYIKKMKIVVEKDPSYNNTGILTMLTHVRSDMVSLHKIIVYSTLTFRDLWVEMGNVYTAEQYDDEGLKKILNLRSSKASLLKAYLETQPEYIDIC